MSRIGIFSGTFDPVHSGHIGLALKAKQDFGLNKIVFLPERTPRHKHGITHYVHRATMLRNSIAGYPALEVLELSERQFSVTKTLPHLNALYSDDELLLLLGSDAVYGLGRWPHLANLLKRCGFIIGIRGSDQAVTLKQHLAALPQSPREAHILPSPSPLVSSKQIREALMDGKTAAGLLKSVQKYSAEHWLYHKIRA